LRNQHHFSTIAQARKFPPFFLAQISAPQALGRACGDMRSMAQSLPPFTTR
jgi:hypothetical protein